VNSDKKLCLIHFRKIGVLTMVSRTQKKILLAIDGSDQSLNTVRYVSKLLASQKPDVVLFHVMRKIDETFWDLGIDPAYHRRVADVSAWALEQKKAIQGFMNYASQILLEAGIPEESVTAKIHESKTGVARDIIKESMNGYSGVVVGRKGLSKLKDLLLGSVAHKLVEKLRHVPIWVVGGTPQLGRILLALDGSEGAMKAVDHVGTLLGHEGCGPRWNSVGRVGL
jgi:nucleotide-binding universal stress UspA family protein